jgi:hypothetical protein
MVARCPVCPVLHVLSVRRDSLLSGSACSPLGCLHQKVNLSVVRPFLPRVIHRLLITVAHLRSSVSLLIVIAIHVQVRSPI